MQLRYNNSRGEAGKWSDTDPNRPGVDHIHETLKTFNANGGGPVNVILEFDTPGDEYVQETTHRLEYRL